MRQTTTTYSNGPNTRLIQTESIKTRAHLIANIQTNETTNMKNTNCMCDN